MAKWILYHTDGCHLCEQAEQLLYTLLPENDELQLIDIMSDEELVSEYQVSIPVLKNQQGQQLFWPFTASHVLKLTAQAE